VRSQVAAAIDVAAAIEVDGITKRYDGRPVLRGVSFRVERGEIFAILGPNGAGKTTTVEILEGYRRPDEGRVRVLGVDPARGSRDHRARVGLMLQGGGGVDPRMSAREVLGLHGRFHRAPRDPDELLSLVGLEAVARTRYRRLSGGERQRLGLALALVGRPQLVALDEPTAGMDVEARATTRALLATLRKDGVTILLTSHDLTDVERVADRIAIIDRGRLIALGVPDELASPSPDAVRLRLRQPLDDSDRETLAARIGAASPGASVVDEGEGRYRVVGARPDPELVAVVASWCAERGVLIMELRVGGATLEERYVELLAAADETDAKEEVD
jgi:ABC-2 type transport system ATP-binding protein